MGQLIVLGERGTRSAFWLALLMAYRAMLLWDTTNLDTDLGASHSARSGAALSGSNGAVT